MLMIIFDKCMLKIILFFFLILLIIKVVIVVLLDVIFYFEKYELDLKGSIFLYIKLLLF